MQLLGFRDIKETVLFLIVASYSNLRVFFPFYSKVMWYLKSLSSLFPYLNLWLYRLKNAFEFQMMCMNVNKQVCFDHSRSLIHIQTVYLE